MTEKDLFPSELTPTKTLVTLFSPEEKFLIKALEIAFILREEGIPTELWPERETKMEKQLKYADQKHIPYAVIIGPEELERNKVMLRDMQNRDQKQLTIEEMITTLS